MERGELQPGRHIGRTVDYVTYLHSIFVPLGVWAVAIGVFGVKATCPSTHVLSPVEKTLYNSRVLFLATAIQTAAHSALLFALAIWLSVAMSREAGPAILGIFWAVAVVVSLSSLYMLHVVWSYKTKLHLVAEGHAEACLNLVRGVAAVTPFVADPVDMMERTAPGTPESSCYLEDPWHSPAHGSISGSGGGSTPLLSRLPPPQGDKRGWGFNGNIAGKKGSGGSSSIR
jgi:hypothetical protein